jgi:hypothetical protein
MPEYVRPRPRPLRQTPVAGPTAHARGGGTGNAEQLERLGLGGGEVGGGAEAALRAAIGATPAGPEEAPAELLTRAVVAPGPEAPATGGADATAKTEAAPVATKRVAPDAGTDAPTE